MTSVSVHLTPSTKMMFIDRQKEKAIKKANEMRKLMVTGLFVLLLLLLHLLQSTSVTESCENRADSELLSCSKH